MDSRPSDESLLLAVAVRDLGAFRTLYERHAGWLAIRLARRCNDRDLVADAIQDTFVAVWHKPRGFRGDGDIAAWLLGIAIRWLGTRGSLAAVFEKAEAVPAAEDQVLLSVEYGDIGQALVRHSPEMRAVIQAVLLDGLSAVRTFPAPGAYGPSPDPLWWIVLARCAVAVAIFGRWPKAAPVDVQSSMIPATSTARVGQQRRRRCSPNAHWCFADLLAAVGQLSTPVPALRQVS